MLSRSVLRDSSGKRLARALLQGKMVASLIHFISPFRETRIACGKSLHSMEFRIDLLRDFPDVPHYLSVTKHVVGKLGSVSIE